ncbi:MULTISPECIES: hypothetical protein [Bacillus]|nr:hypothetical protein [Bacillus mycoides]
MKKQSINAYVKELNEREGLIVIVELKWSYLFLYNKGKPTF